MNSKWSEPLIHSAGSVIFYSLLCFAASSAPFHFFLRLVVLLPLRCSSHFNFRARVRSALPFREDDA